MGRDRKNSSKLTYLAYSGQAMPRELLSDSRPADCSQLNRSTLHFSPLSTRHMCQVFYVRSLAVLSSTFHT